MRKVERKLSLMLEDGAGIVEERFEDPIKHQPTSLSVLHMISHVTTLGTKYRSVHVDINHMI